ncbi:MAG TPA: AbrB/MazE/SpoVT family DNA-binding domain-containing protein [Thermoanaerobaculia bacterium]
MSVTSRVTIDRVGRMVIPKEIRDEAGIEPGMPLTITCREGRIEIEPERRPIRIVKRGRLQVAEAVEEAGEPLSAETVKRTQARVRSEEE